MAWVILGSFGVCSLLRGGCCNPAWTITPRQRLHKALRSETITPLPAFFPGSQADGEDLAHLYSSSLFQFPRSAHPPGFFFVLQTTRTETHVKPTLPWLCSGGLRHTSTGLGLHKQSRISCYHLIFLHRPSAFAQEPQQISIKAMSFPAGIWRVTAGCWWSINYVPQQFHREMICFSGS